MRAIRRQHADAGKSVNLGATGLRSAVDYHEEGDQMIIPSR
ncbi:MAG: hypothetical protein AVDCRST_MAG26-2815 [uncultured Chloroflexia bacterium]|uniref:Uncharacterized protein n=1 Tax=uncultured Chloroflexia bacterium TaxID=1672391 RepID=A0A6J4J8J9_9CHLR|nr:MAG: hypothetical protein AVDCRST_MAG26-2815 [uncultured Chloroflexia bacterium]